MKKKQALLRIESLIETDYKQIKEYNFFLSDTSKYGKKFHYSGLIGILKKSIERKKLALIDTKNRGEAEYVWEDICKKFKFKPYLE